MHQLRGQHRLKDQRTGPLSKARLIAPDRPQRRRDHPVEAAPGPRKIPERQQLLPKGQCQVHLTEGFLLFEDARQIELLFRPGEGHIEHPLLLPETLPQLFPGNGLLEERRCLQPRLKIYIIRGHAQLRIQQHRRVQIRPVEGLVEARREDDRVLQALALVDAEDAHHIFRL